MELGSLMMISCRLTCRHAVEAYINIGGPHWHAAGQATQHRLNGEAFGFLAMKGHQLLHLHRFNLHAALWEQLKK